MSNVHNVRPRPSIRKVLQFLLGLLLILTAQGLSAQTPRYVEYRSGWDTQNGFFKMYLYAAINPSTRAVQLSGGHLDFKDLDQPYKILQAAGNKVPRLGPNQMAGDVFFSQANIGITATLFTGQLTGALGAAGSTLTANNVRFDHRGRTYQVNFVLTPTSPMPGPSPTPTPAPAPAPSGNLIFDNTNSNTVNNNPSAKTVVVLRMPTLVAQIWTYHWNNGRGAAPGTIALVDQSGQTHGPWPAVGSPGANGAANENWTASPNVTLPAGSYTVVDSSPTTWGQNSQSKGCGYTKVWGKAGISLPPPPPPPSRLPPPSPSGPVTLLFDCSNTGGVGNNPTAKTVFTLTKQMVVTQIWNYHWNNAQGATPGSISLVNANGKIFGPWAAKGSAGSNNAQNVNWTVDANVTLPAGSYTIQDSAPATWAQNSQSGGRGFSKVWGH